jgi:hypothetical protein
MSDYFLRGATHEAVMSALLAAGQVIDPQSTEDGQIWPADGVDLAPIGEISEGGRWGPDGEVIAPAEIRPGWHANLRVTTVLSSAQLDALALVLIDPPATPYMTWA